MKFSDVLFLVVSFAVSGCASNILESEEKKVFQGEALDVIQPVSVASLDEAGKLSSYLAAAYFKAATESQNAQDAINVLTNLVGASVVAGAVKGTSDAALANRGIAAVGLQRIGAKGFGKTTIESLYDGAQSLSCVSGVIAIYNSDGDLKTIPEAKIVTLHVIREIRIAVRRGLTRSVDSYSDILTAFQTGIPGEEIGKRRVDGFEVATAKKSQILVEYLTRLNGCVKQKNFSEAGKSP